MLVCRCAVKARRTRPVVAVAQEVKSAFLSAVRITSSSSFAPLPSFLLSFTLTRVCSQSYRLRLATAYRNPTHNSDLDRHSNPRRARSARTRHSHPRAFGHPPESPIHLDSCFCLSSHTACQRGGGKPERDWNQLHAAFPPGTKLHHPRGSRCCRHCCVYSSSASHVCLGKRNFGRRGRGCECRRSEWDWSEGA